MDLNHLHLAVSDLDISTDFYVELFQFSKKAEFGPELRFLKNEEGFDLALSLSKEVKPLPDCVHFGFSFKTKEELLSFYERGCNSFKKSFIEEPTDKGDFISFVCVDPDGYHIELYWDPNLQ